jgi:hypothetical protein
VIPCGILGLAAVEYLGPGLAFTAERIIGSGTEFTTEQVIARLAQAAPAFEERMRASVWDVRGVAVPQVWEGHNTWLVAGLASVADVESMKQAVLARAHSEAEDQRSRGREPQEVTDDDSRSESGSGTPPNWWEHKNLPDRDSVLIGGWSEHELWVFSRAQKRVWVRFSS